MKYLMMNLIFLTTLMFGGCKLKTEDAPIVTPKAKQTNAPVAKQQTLSLKQTTYVTVDSLKIRSTPDLSGKSSQTLVKGDSPKVLQLSENETTVDNITAKWAEIKYGSKTGWVFSGFLSNTPPKLLTDAELSKIKSANEKIYAREVARHDAYMKNLGNVGAMPPHPSDIVDKAEGCSMKGYTVIPALEAEKGCTTFKRDLMLEMKLKPEEFGDKYCLDYLTYYEPYGCKYIN